MGIFGGGRSVEVILVRGGSAGVMMEFLDAGRGGGERGRGAKREVRVREEGLETRFVT